MVKDSEFSSSTKNEVSDLINNKKDAFDMLREVLEGEGCYDYSEIVTRLQTQFFAYERNRQNILTAQAWRNGWRNNSFRVNKTIAPITSNNEYSSFALIEPSDELLLHYPLDDDYISLNGPFALKDETEYTEQNFNRELKNIEDKLGIVVTQKENFSSSKFKQSFMKRAIVKIKNIFYKLSKKQHEMQTSYSGKINLNTNVEGFKPSYVDRLAKVYDYILKVSVKDVAKSYKNGEKLPKSLLFVSRIYANILMSRVLDLRDVSNNKKLEKCLWLQYANNLNKYCFNSNDLKLITTIGLEAATKTCKKLGISTSNIISKMTMLGFKYDCVPTDEKSALIKATQRDYSIYSQESVEKRLEKEKAETIGEKEDKAKTDTKSETKEEEKVHFSTNVKSSNVKESTITKMVDKAVVNCLSTQGTNLAEKINLGKVNGKKLEKTTAQLNLYNLVLSYYVQASRSKPMSVKNEGQFNENEISKAKLIVQAIIHERQSLIENVAANSDHKQENQSSRAFVNEVCKELNKDSVAKYFTKLVKNAVEHFTTEKSEESTKATEKAEVSDVLNEQLLEDLDKKYEEISNYVPDFVFVDEQETQNNSEADLETEYKPNFIIIDENSNSSGNQKE